MFGGVQFGSSNKLETVSNVETFDVKQRSWKSARPLLKRSGHHSSVLVPRSWFDGKQSEFYYSKRQNPIFYPCVAVLCSAAFALFTLHLLSFTVYF